MNALEQYDANRRLIAADEYRYAREEAHRRVREGVARGMATVCNAMAVNCGVVGAFCADPEVAAKAMADSYRWTMAGAVAGMGRPELVTQFLDDTKGACDER